MLHRILVASGIGVVLSGTRTVVEDHGHGWGAALVGVHLALLLGFSRLSRTGRR